MGLAVFYVIIGSIVLQGHLHEVAENNEATDNLLYTNDFYSRIFQGAVAFTLVVSIPTIMDILLSLNYLQTWEELQTPMEFARRCILYIVVVPNFFIYWEVMPVALVDLIMFFQYLLVFYTLIFRVHTLSMNQQKANNVAAYPLRDLFVNCIVTMTMGFCYKLATHGKLPGRTIWKGLYTAFLLLFQLLTCMKLKPWFSFTWQLSKVVKNDILLQNKVAFFAVMAGIVACTAMSIIDAITFEYAYIYFPKSSKSFIAVEWWFCALLVSWSSVKNFELLKTQIATAVSILFVQSIYEIVNI